MAPLIFLSGIFLSGIFLSAFRPCFLEKG